jgi:hypothetical protein
VFIEMLFDDVLLEIFDLFLDEDEDIDIDPWYARNEENGRYSYDAWYVLAHVCQRWRYVVFASPCRLNLRLHCSRRPVREMLGIWPAFPIVVWDVQGLLSDEDSIIASLEHRDRVCEIRLECLSSLQLETLIPLMQESFPALTKLQLETFSFRRDVLPDSFLGGSAPHLRFLYLVDISFPAFPNLLLSASNLVHLYLSGILFGYISPEMVAAFSALTKLEHMRICFGYPDSDSDLKGPAPPSLTRSVLPALKGLEFRGHGEYLDDFVARIDVPSINYLKIVFTNRPFFVRVGDFFHLSQLIGRVEKFLSSDYARFDLRDRALNVTLSLQGWTRGSLPGALQLKFYCDTDGPLPCLVEACNTSLLPLSNIENFDIFAKDINPESESGFMTDDPQWWLEVLRQFPTAKSLSLGSMRVVPPVAFALKQVIEEGMTDVLPAIQKLSVFRFLSAGPDREAIEQFVAARGLSGLEMPAFSARRSSARVTRGG